MNRKNGPGKFLKLRKNILVKNGVDVKKQVLSSGSGEFFTGGIKECETSYINPSYSQAWKISFRHMDSGSISRFRFSGQMRIGRVPSAQPGEVCLVLQEDPKVSQNHCIVYEVKGNLCLEDQHSKNYTYLNGRRIDTPVFLTSGDIIRLGDTVLKIEFGR